MANFNPPDSHWADDFDSRLLSSFHHLKDKVEEALGLAYELKRDNERLRKELAQAVSDAAHFYRGDAK